MLFLWDVALCGRGGRTVTTRKRICTAENPDTELFMDEWFCAVSYITSRRVYLQRTTVAGIPRYELDGHPEGQVSETEAQSAGQRLAIIEQRWLRMKERQAEQ